MHRGCWGCLECGGRCYGVLRGARRGLKRWLRSAEVMLWGAVMLQKATSNLLEASGWHWPKGNHVGTGSE